LFPPGLIPGTAMQSAVIVLEPQKPAVRKGRTRLVDLTQVEQQGMADAVRKALAEEERDGANRSITVSLEGIRDKDFSLLPTPYLPPRDVRATLLTREQAGKEVESALANLLNEVRGFNEVIQT